jgi:hypothetical protein
MRKPLTLPLAIGVALLTLTLAGCRAEGEGTGDSPGSSPQATEEPPSSDAEATVLWPAPPDPLERTVAAGLEPAPKEFLTNHVHAHLDVFLDGEPIAVPAGIGINLEDPEVKQFDDPEGVSYGGIELCSEPCISPLHTHDGTGIIHTESATPEPNTLGQFFTEWGVDLSDSCVGEYCSPDQPIEVYVDGQPYTQDPRAIELTDRKQIAIVIGAPPAEIPATADFSNA